MANEITPEQLEALKTLRKDKELTNKYLEITTENLSLLMKASHISLNSVFADLNGLNIPLSSYGKEIEMLRAKINQNLALMEYLKIPKELIKNYDEIFDKGEKVFV